MKALLILLFTVSSLASMAAENELIDKIIVREIDSFTPEFFNDCSDFGSHLSPINITPGEKSKLGTIVNTGKFVWEIIKENRPTLNLKKQSASALPSDLDWTLMQCWSLPSSKSFQVAYINGFGIEVVSFVFQIQYSYGGNYKGAGQYLKEVTILPKVVDVLWGYNFDAVISTPSVTNINSNEAPVAGMELQIDWTVSTMMKISKRVLSFFVTGDGKLYEVGH